MPVQKCLAAVLRYLVRVRVRVRLRVRFRGRVRVRVRVRLRLRVRVRVRVSEVPLVVCGAHARGEGHRLGLEVDAQREAVSHLARVEVRVRVVFKGSRTAPAQG